MSDYDAYRFHDNQIHGIAFRTADPDRDDWTSDLVLDIDHILEWVKDDDRVRFRVQPATLTFHGVANLSLTLDGTVEGYRVGVALPWILQIERELIPNAGVHFDRPYYDWRVVLSTNPSGDLSFGAWGYTLGLRGEAVLQDEQTLTHAQRSGVE